MLQLAFVPFLILSFGAITSLSFMLKAPMQKTHKTYSSQKQTDNHPRSYDKFSWRYLWNYSNNRKLLVVRAHPEQEYVNPVPHQRTEKTVAAQMQTALVEYKQIHGNLHVPRNFVVPNDDVRFSPASRGAPLGKFITDILFYFYNDPYKDHKDEMIAMGFEYNQDALDVEVVKRSLLVYKELFGDFDVPVFYIAPEDDDRFPERIKGQELGLVIAQIRELDDFRAFTKEFVDLGLTLSFEPRPFAHFQQAFLRYKELYGHTFIKKGYIIGLDDLDYPEDARGLELSKYCECIRNGHIYSQYKCELEALEFDFNESEVSFEVVKQSLMAYKQTFGDLLVPLNFTIAANDKRFPSAAWGLNLGTIVHNIHNKFIYQEHEDELISLGMGLTSDTLEFADLHDALLTYKQLYGDLNVMPLTFDIAPDDARFPTSLRGKNFGRRVFRIRKLKEFRNYRKKLQALGMTFMQPTVPFELFKTTLQRYKEVYGTYLVPYVYKIVGMERALYPEESKDLPLGKYVDAVRTGHFYPEHKEELEEMEFELDRSKEDLELLERALTAYRSLHGDLSVPAHYNIAWNDTNYPPPIRGLRLGELVHNRLNRQPQQEYQKAQLAAMGLDYEEEAFTLVREALLVYKQIHGDLLYVPQRYTIPLNDERYPETTRGMSLGKIVSRIRYEDYFIQHKEDLIAMGFDYDRQHLPFRSMQAALLAYQAIHGHVNVQKSYVVAKDDIRFPKVVRGRDLGSRVAKMRSLDDYIEYHKELVELGMTFTFKPRPFEVFKTTLLTYKELYGDFGMPYKYVVPANEPRFSREVVGFQLHKYVDCIKAGHIYEEHKQELLALGFDFHLKSGVELVKEAFAAYKKIYGHLRVPYDFIIAMDDTRYPGDVRGMNLGNVVYKIHTQDYYRMFREDFRAMGFDYDDEEVPFVVMQQALVAFKQEHGHLEVPKTYPVAADDVRYPVELRGHDLGIRVDKIRSLDLYRCHRKELEELGITFSFQPKPFELFQTALQKCKELFGRCDVPADYRVLSGDTRFPEEVRGLELGKYVDCVVTGHIYCSHQAELQDLGLEFGIETEFQAVKEMLLLYKEFHGSHFPMEHYLIRYDNRRYPPSMQGQELGKLARKFYAHPKYQALMQALGFFYDKRFEDYALLEAALKAYKAIHGDLCVPREYTIAADDTRYPEATRDLRLGYFVFLVSVHGYHSVHKSELRTMGLGFAKDYVPFATMKIALEVYHDLYGDLNVPNSFIIPLNDINYPSELRGKDLGKKVARIRNGDAHRGHWRELQALGITFTFISKPFSLFRTAVEAFQVVHGKVPIPRDFIISQLDTRYPKQVRGMLLGKHVQLAFSGFIYSEHSEELANMGVFFTPTPSDSKKTQRSIATKKKVPVELHDDYYSSFSEHYVIPVSDALLRSTSLASHVHNQLPQSSYTHLLPLGMGQGYRGGEFAWD